LSTVDSVSNNIFASAHVHITKQPDTPVAALSYCVYKADCVSLRYDTTRSAINLEFLVGNQQLAEFAVDPADKGRRSF
jgi:hypothetical protein